MVQLKKILKYLSSINTLLERKRERERERSTKIGGGAFNYVLSSGKIGGGQKYNI